MRFLILGRSLGLKKKNKKNRKKDDVKNTQIPYAYGPGGRRGLQPPQNFRQLRIFGQQEKIWAKPVFKDVSMFLLLF